MTKRLVIDIDRFGLDKFLSMDPFMLFRGKGEKQLGAYNTVQFNVTDWNKELLELLAQVQAKFPGRAVVAYRANPDDGTSTVFSNWRRFSAEAKGAGLTLAGVTGVVSARTKSNLSASGVPIAPQPSPSAALYDMAGPDAPKGPQALKLSPTGMGLKAVGGPSDLGPRDTTFKFIPPKGPVPGSRTAKPTDVRGVVAPPPPEAGTEEKRLGEPQVVPTAAPAPRRGRVVTRPAKPLLTEPGSYTGPGVESPQIQERIGKYSIGARKPSDPEPFSREANFMSLAGWRRWKSGYYNKFLRRKRAEDQVPAPLALVDEEDADEDVG